MKAVRAPSGSWGELSRQRGEQSKGPEADVRLPCSRRARARGEQQGCRQVMKGSEGRGEGFGFCSGADGEPFAGS